MSQSFSRSQAIIASRKTFQDRGKVLLVVLPAIASLASLLLARFHFEEMEGVRERGRIDFQRLLQWAKMKFALAKDEQSCQKLHDELLKKVTALEREQLLSAGTIRRSRTDREDTGGAAKGPV